ncbi:MAG: nitrate reductase subunit alpha [Candidatus Abyssobacteria bacterium SURF_5]|uniref:nitrate reductase (quinone) n=1 Tax=Abyssobacteria bacterium (strain SURF_5) TaxID=2093360 RepID=A0A3A4PAY1_ABYX5|nr:MAG: nitrate reductase subunit alpha [Candidatus Abyssubacteria bacterium SURF_5]
MKLIKDVFNPGKRLWEEMYRNRWAHDLVVRSTHGNNCTGGCSWWVYVKDGIVVWELQALDYPLLEPGIPPYEPRGCPRGICYSWYLYSPVRIKYPYVRGVLLDLWRAARAKHADPVDAWASIVENPDSRRSYQLARGKGGFRRSDWQESVDIIVASLLYTAKKYGPDRVVGFTPIPAMSMISYTAGARFLQLFGAPLLSFYDTYADFPPASPEVWGEKTDVAESADWYNSKFIAVAGNNLDMTRTPDAHYAVEARNHGAKMVVFSSDYSDVSKHADWWIPIQAGMDGAFWMGATHVILRQFYVDRQVPAFIDYVKRFTDLPFLVQLTKTDGGYAPGRFLRANRLKRYRDEENGDWKFLMFDKISGEPRMPQGSIGSRWQEKKGSWNLLLKDGADGSDIHPLLTFIDNADEDLPVSFDDFGGSASFVRGVPVRYLYADQGKIAVTTSFDLLMAHMGVRRGSLRGYPNNYDEDSPFTPAWQEKYTGIGRKTCVRFAEEWALTAEKTGGKCTVIIGSGVNHWYHCSLHYRACIMALMLCGCVGVNGGGLNHYTGQEKVWPDASWKMLAMANDWMGASRLQNGPSYHYVHGDQWHYEQSHADYHPPAGRFASKHTIDFQALAVRLGWLPFYPQFNRNPLELAVEANDAGAQTSEEIVQWVARQLKDRNLRFAIDDPDAPENWPRVFFVWRANALMASARGHEYFLKHYLGAQAGSIADEVASGNTEHVQCRVPAPTGKMDLVIDINFRMDTTALYSDIILPSASWYEKDDLNTTDLHSYIHPLGQAVPPCWDSMTDWDIFRTIAFRFSELAPHHFPNPFKDVVASALEHDTPHEIAQPEVRDWMKGECEPVPGKTMPVMTVVERDYVNLFNRFVSLGPRLREKGIEGRGAAIPLDGLYDKFMAGAPTYEWRGKSFPSLYNAIDAINALLFFAPECNGEAAYLGFKEMEKSVGLPLADLAEGQRQTRYDFLSLVRQPRRILTNPVWTGILNEGRPYNAFVQNVERLVPWRTLTGRQHFYLDHEGYLAFGEHLPTFKPKLSLDQSRNIIRSKRIGKCAALNFLTPHGKWHIHSTYYDTPNMLTLSRGIEPLWMNDRDAREIGIMDNDWVEAYNDHGVVITRAAVSARIPRGVCMLYHAPERTLFPKAPLRKMRGGTHNSLTSLRLKPVHMMGAYAQLSYRFNQYGPPMTERDTYVLVHKVKKPKWR